MTAEEREAYLFGRQRFEAGDDPAALSAFHRVLETCPRFADVHYMVGLLHERGGALEEATSHLERALTINPGYAECVVALVSVYEQQGRFDDSRALAERASERFGPGPGPLDATTRGKLANLHAALEAYRKALDRAPAFHDIRYRLARALREAGLPSRALAELRRVLRGNPAYLEAAVQLGLTWYTLGRAEEAVAEWEAVLERDPSRDDARMYLRMVRAQEAEPRSG